MKSTKRSIAVSVSLDKDKIVLRSLMHSLERSSSKSSMRISLYPIIALRGVLKLCLNSEYSSEVLVFLSEAVFSLKASSY